MRKEREKASGKTFYISEKKKNELINYLCTHGPIYIPTRC